MKFKLVEKLSDFDTLIKKYNKKKYPKNTASYKQGFFDPEKETEIFNHIQGADATESSSTTSECSCASNESLLQEDRILNKDLTMTKKAQILYLVWKNSGKYSRKDLMRMVNIENWDHPGEYSTNWAKWMDAGLISSDKGKVVAGPALENWITSNNVEQQLIVAQQAEKALKQQLQDQGIIIDNNMVSFPDNFFES